MKNEMSYTVEDNDVIVECGGIYEGTLKCPTSSEAHAAADELRAGTDSDDVAGMYSGEWLY